MSLESLVDKYLERYRLPIFWVYFVIIITLFSTLVELIGLDKSVSYLGSTIVIVIIPIFPELLMIVSNTLRASPSFISQFLKEVCYFIVQIIGFPFTVIAELLDIIRAYLSFLKAKRKVSETLDNIQRHLLKNNIHDKYVTAIVTSLIRDQPSESLEIIAKLLREDLITENAHLKATRLIWEYHRYKQIIIAHAKTSGSDD